MTKMLVCKEPGCLDVIELYPDEPRVCKCGKSKGIFLSDNHHALIVGPAIALGLHSKDLQEVINPSSDVQEAGYWPVRLWRIPDGDRIILVENGQVKVPCSRCQPGCQLVDEARKKAAESVQWHRR